MIPLFISAFQRAEELAIAMEVRGYDINIKRKAIGYCIGNIKTQ